MKFYNYDELQNMMANIAAEGADEVWKTLEEEEKNAIERFRKRDLYFKALERMKTK